MNRKSPKFAPHREKIYSWAEQQGDIGLVSNSLDNQFGQMAEVPEPLPNGWRWTNLGEVVESMKNGIYKPSSFYADEGVACLRMYNIDGGKIIWRDIKRMRLSEQEFLDYELISGDVLINRVNSRELVGKAAVITSGMEHCVFESKNIRIRLRPNTVLPQFINYRLLSAGSRYFACNAQQVVGMASISQPQIARFPIPLPPISEQHQIVVEIEKQFTRLDTGVAALLRMQANLKRYRAAILKAACEGRLVPTEAELTRADNRRVPFETGETLLGRIIKDRQKTWQGHGKYREPNVPSSVRSFSIPKGWTWASVDQLLRESLCNGLSIKGSDNPPGVRALRLSAMSNSGFDYNDVRYLPIAESDVNDLWIQNFDFFMSRGNGSLHLVGRGTSAQIPPLPTIFPDTMIRLRLANPVETTGWLRTIWPSHLIRAQIEIKVKTTAGIYKISQSQVEGIVIPLPPLAEQKRIVAEVERRLSVVEELEALVAATLKRATRLRQSILQKAFTGELVQS